MLLQVDLYTVVCAASSTASLVCCVVSTSSENAPTLRLIASYLLHECIRQHESSLQSIIMQTDVEAQANAESYTLASALQGQAKDSTHEDLEAFQNDCILPFLSKSLPSRISSAFESAENLSTKIMGGVILNCESHEVAYSWTRNGKMLESIFHGLLLFARFLIDLPGDGNKTLVQAPVSECGELLVLLQKLEMDGFCAAIVSTDTSCMMKHARAERADQVLRPLSNPLSQPGYSSFQVSTGSVWTFISQPHAIDSTMEEAMSVFTALLGAPLRPTADISSISMNSPRLPESTIK
ncbi:hypothetical protein AC1031_016219 [Aphanomyces cochlioides]|nr:hypothetical protein AC1031_016219 [Aphanomyces cochlioides]